MKRDQLLSLAILTLFILPDTAQVDMAKKPCIILE